MIVKDTFDSYQKAMDSVTLIDVIKDHFNIYDDSQIRIKLKYALKSVNERNKLIDKLQLDVKDLIRVLYSAFPDVFTKRLLTSLRKQFSKNTNNSRVEKEKRDADIARRRIQRMASPNVVFQTWFLSQVCSKFRNSEIEE